MSKHWKENVGKAPEELQRKHDKTPMVDTFIVFAPKGVAPKRLRHTHCFISMVQVPEGRRTEMKCDVDKMLVPIGAFHWRDGAVLTSLFDPAMKRVFLKVVREFLLLADIDPSLCRLT